MNNYEIWLRRLIYLNGAFLLLATLAVFLPTAVMAGAHEMLGLGRFPDSTITIYLARSTSLLYAVHGAVTLIVALKWNQFHEMVPLLAVLHVVIGLAMIGIDVTSGMPRYWIVLEGGPIACFGLFLLWLYQQAGLGATSKQAAG